MFFDAEINWKDYEAITKYIYESLGAQYGIKVKGYGNNFNLAGKSGIKHQIDVLTEQFNGVKHFYTAIECKYWNKKVNKDVVMKLSKIMEDLNIECGIIVCKSGFTKDTLKFAEHEGIKLVILNEMEGHDDDSNQEVEIGTLDIKIKMSVSKTNITCISLGNKIIIDDHEILYMYYVTLNDSLGRNFQFGKYLREFSEKLEKRGELLKSITIEFALGSTLFWKQHNEIIAIDKIGISGYLSKTDQNSTCLFKLTDQIWMIMNDLFDKKKIALSKTGLVWYQQ